ncbi:MAG: hypothetical protein ACHQIL_14645 [Steroidobacterales bacterium]
MSRKYVQERGVALIEKLNFLKIGTDAAAATAEDERLMQLFQNRAGLKKAYDDLQEELHLLGDRLKQQEGATMRLQEQLDQLGELLADPATGYGALVFYQLRALWKACHQQLATFAAGLARQHEVREAAAYQEEWQTRQRERLAQIDERLGAAMAAARASRQAHADMQDGLQRLTAFWHYFRRRRLQKAIEPMRAQVAAADADVAAIDAERRAVADDAMADFPGISLRARRNTNLAIIGYAELLCELVEGFSVTVRAKEAVARRVQDMEFGSRADCERDMQRVQKALAAVMGQNPLKAGVKAKLEALRASCQYRNAADTVPTADSLESARSHSGTGAVYPWNVLAEDYWDLYTLLLR